MTQLKNGSRVSAADEVARLMRAIEALANPCCRGAGISSFKVMARDGQPTGEEVSLCEGCGREVALIEA